MEPIKESIYTQKVGSQKSYQTWWISSKADVASNVNQIVTAIQMNQSERRAQDLRHVYLYQNRRTSDTTMGAPGMRGLPDAFNVTYNVVKSSVDTLSAKISTNRPRTRVMTEKGDYDKQTRAKNLTQYIGGVFDAPYNKTHRQGSAAFKDGCILGTGVVKVIPDHTNGRILTERVLSTEIVVDDLEGAYGNPQSLYQIRLVSRDVLLRQFGDDKENFNAIMRTPPENIRSKQSTSVDMLKVIEAWHLPSDSGEEGRHVICLLDHALADDEWKHPKFPFAFFRYQTAIASFYGQGVAEELLGAQLEINKLLRDIQRAQHLIGVPRMYKERSSKVNAANLNNGMGEIIEYTGIKPEFFTPTAMNNEIYNHVKWLIQSAYEKVGVSQLSAAGKKPAGLDSKVALREMQDIESERFTNVQDNYFAFFDEIADLIIRFSKELYESNPDLSITAQSKKFIEKIKWSEVDMDDDCFVTQVYNSSLFPTQPAAKLAKIQEYIQSGFMTKEDGIREMAYPDIESWETLETADRDYLERSINDILSRGKYRAPEPEMLLDQDVTVARKHYLEALNNEADPERLELLLRWIEAATSLMPAPPPAPVPAPMAPAGPLAQAAPLPVSDLVPQV